MEPNPYQTPKANIDTATEGDLAGSEEIRNQYLNHEASLRSIGLLYYFMGTTVLIAVFMFLFSLFSPTESPRNDIPLWGTALMALLSLIYLWLGRGFRTLNSKIKIPATIVAILGLISIPIGTLIGGYILYLIYSSKGRMVLSEEYSKVMAATPHIKTRTSVIVWIVLGMVLLAIGAAVVLPMVAQH